MRVMLCSCFGPLVCLTALAFVQSNNASAAIVSFIGQFTTGGGANPLLGNIPFPDPARSYTASFDFTEASGVINSGSFAVSGLVAFSVTGGNISVSGSGGADSATLFANFTGPANGSLTTVVNSGNVITGDASSLGNLNTLLANSNFLSASILNITGNNAGTYNGSVSAVPEPGSGLICTAVLLTGVFRRQRTGRGRTLL